MPELYSNQVKLNAASQPRATAPKFDDFVGRALGNLADTMSGIVQDVQKNEDVNLRMKVAARTKEAMNLVENADPKDFNYAQIKEQAAAIYASAFDGASEATINRFYRDNPDNDVLFTIGVDSTAAKKTRDSQYYNFQTELPNMASEVAVNNRPIEFYNAQIDSSGLTNGQKNKMKSELRKSVSEYSISAALSQGNTQGLLTAEKELEKADNYITPERKAYWAALISSTKEKIEKNKKEAKNDRDSALSDSLFEAYLTIKKKDGKAAAEKFRQDLETFEGTITVGGVTISTDPKSPHYISNTFLNSVMERIDTKSATTQSDVIYEAQTRQQAADLLSFADKYKKTSDKDALLEKGIQAGKFMNSFAFKELKESDQQKIAKLASDFTYDVGVSLMGDDKMIQYRNISGGQKGTSWFAGAVPEFAIPRWSSIPSRPKAIIGAIKNNNDEEIMAAIKYGKQNLADNVLKGKLAIDDNTNGSVLANAVTFLDAAIRDPEVVNRLGLQGISHKSLYKAYEDAMYASLVDGSYGQEAEAAFNPLEILCTAASGGRFNPTDEQKKALAGYESDVVMADYTTGGQYIPSRSDENILINRKPVRDTGFRK